MGAYCSTKQEQTPPPISRSLEFESKLKTSNRQHLINNEPNHERTEDITLISHPVCYCGRKLRSDTFDFSEFDWRCSHCFEKYHKTATLSYWCHGQSKCTFNQVTNLYYIVCPKCYDAMITNDGYPKHDIDEFFLRKIRSQTQYIRNVISLKNQKKSQLIDKYCEFMYAFFFQQFICQLKDVIMQPYWDQIVEEFHAFYNPIRDSKLYA
eukprot:694432_1